MRPLTLEANDAQEPLAATAAVGAPEPAFPVWKRATDLVVASIAVLLLAAPMLATALLVRLTSNGPVIFRQTRVGLSGRHFTILKFRTMEGDRNRAADIQSFRKELLGVGTASGGLFVYGDMRYTPIGLFLRRYSIDELPQLFNVLRGDMSLVGPRPAVPWESEQFDEKYQRRHLTPPGITGLWQVSGRNALTTLEMLDLDLRYVEARSWLFDLKILLRTPKAVLFDRMTA